ncbi:hypothetical protein [Methylobacterium goesingense]|jgi:hypothetical protein|uniref:Uncharacterized protein n=1 Tax=Methylobacterium goesingense TaxID=243690 RepID=A0ABV2L752_9HYPH|nr:hypothetical protein [Methylobacterium goesingense]GJD73702.1 hypothetical protein CFIICLFH_1932 [Methylobacterium goesingense]
MSSDTDTHRDLLAALKAAAGQGGDAFEQATIRAFEHVFAHLERLNAHVSQGGPDGEDRPLAAGESATLR